MCSEYLQGGQGPAPPVPQVDMLAQMILTALRLKR